MPGTNSPPGEDVVTTAPVGQLEALPLLFQLEALPLCLIWRLHALLGLVGDAVYAFAL